MAQDKLKDLEGRIEKIEQSLSGGMTREAVEISPDEMKTFMKVRDVIAADFGEFCGINDCFRCTLCRSCFVCGTCRICRACIVECTCGPCLRGGTMGGVGDFTQFGG